MEQPVYLSHMNIVGPRWVFENKQQSDKAVERFKVRFVAKGYNQISFIDFQDTFSPIIKATTSRVVLSIATTLHLEINHLYVKYTFLHSDLKKNN